MKILTDIKNKIQNKISIIEQAAESQQQWNTLARKISPSSIKEFDKYIAIDNQIYARTLIIGTPPNSDINGYPDELNPKIIDELLSISSLGYSVSFSYTIIPIPNLKSMKLIEDAIFKTEVSKESKRNKQSISEQLEEGQLKKELVKKDLTTNFKSVFNNEQRMFHTAFIIIIWGISKDNIEEAEDHIKLILESNKVYYEFPDYRHLDTFLAAQPYPDTVDYSYIELFSYHAASLVATRNPNSRTDQVGLYFGDDKKTGKNIQINLSNLSAQHLSFVGPTGSGKTFTLLVLLMRAYSMLGKRIIYITPKADVTTDYRNVARYYGKSATIIDIGEGRHNINPLQIIYDTNIIPTESDFDRHLELLDDFFSVLFEESKPDDMSSYLNETLMQCYRQKGIHRDNPQTWNIEAPTLLDLREIWLHDSENPKNTTAKAFANRTYMVNTLWSYMNKPTDINTNADFIVIDISQVPKSLQDAMNVFITGFMGMRFRTDTKKETVIAVDEGAVFFRNPKLSLFLLKTLTQGRSYNIALWLATQQPSDLIKANLEDEFKTNIQISIVLGNMRPDTIEHVKSFYKLNKQDIDNLLSCGVGEGLLIIGSEVIPTKFVPTNHEYNIIKNNNLTKTIETTESIKFVNKSLSEIADDNGTYFNDWIIGDSNVLASKGYKLHNVPIAVGTGTVNVWINPNKVKNIENLDHYCTLSQINGWLSQRGIEYVHIYYNENDNTNEPDMVTKIKGKTIAFEYELPGDHTPHELIKLREQTENKYDKVYFICNLLNYKILIETLGEDYVVQYGSNLETLLNKLINI